MLHLAQKIVNLFVLTTPLALLLTGCGGVSVNNAQVSDIGWLEGQWKGSSGQKGIVSTYKQLSDQNITGSSYITEQNDTIGIRAIDISPTEGKILLNLRTKRNRSAVGYELTEIGSKKAVFQNEEAQYPRTIAYSLNKDTLQTKWTGKDKEETYQLVKAE